MITIDNVQYRNLEEQVKKNMDDIKYILEEEGVLNEFGIKVVGQITSSSQLPDPDTYEGGYGDAYAVGTSAPYTLYIYTRANGTHPTDYWFNIGRFPVPGPQGATGPTGPQGATGTRGSTWSSGTSAPTTSGNLSGDKYLNTTNGDVYNYTGTAWQLVGNIRGPQGIQGPQGNVGPAGPQGIQGPQGDKGDPGPAVVIAGTLANEGQLPDPSTLADNIAYLVGNDTDGYDLYVQLQDTQTWKNVGKIESVEGPQGEQGPQGPQGPQGIQGIQGIQGPTGPQGEGVEKIVDGTLLAKKAEQDANGNVIDTTYAKKDEVQQDIENALVPISAAISEKLTIKSVDLGVAELTPNVNTVIKFSDITADGFILSDVMFLEYLPFNTTVGNMNNNSIVCCEYSGEGLTSRVVCNYGMNGDQVGVLSVQTTPTYTSIYNYTGSNVYAIRLYFLGRYNNDN